MKIYVIRHGLTELNKQKKVNGQMDEPLAPEGIKQAQATASLIPKTVKYIYTSPLIRAKQTAEILNSKLKLSIFIEDDLSEIHMGSLAGKAWEEMENGLSLKKQHRTAKFNYLKYGGESTQQVKNRLIKFFKSIKGKYKDNEVLIITHGGIIRFLHILNHKPLSTNIDVEHISPYSLDLDKILQRN